MKNMKGVITAGGLGTRLRPITRITNKHLLPVYKKPMILYPLETLRRSGIEEIMIVCGREHAGHFMNFLGSGKEHGVKLSYAVQDRDDGGIADALRYAEDFADGGSIAMILGDNIFEQDFKKAVEKFRSGTAIFLKKVPDAERFGTPVFDRTKTKILKIVEKPKRPASPYADVGFYLFDNRIFDIIRTLSPSGRGELEIVDATNEYIKKGEYTFELVKGFWSDAGTFDTLLATAQWVAKRAARGR